MCLEYRILSLSLSLTLLTLCQFSQRAMLTSACTFGWIINRLYVALVIFTHSQTNQLSLSLPLSVLVCAFHSIPSVINAWLMKQLCACHRTSPTCESKFFCHRSESHLLLELDKVSLSLPAPHSVFAHSLRLCYFDSLCSCAFHQSTRKKKKKSEERTSKKERGRRREEKKKHPWVSRCHTWTAADDLPPGQREATPAGLVSPDVPVIRKTNSHVPFSLSISQSKCTCVLSFHHR